MTAPLKERIVRHISMNGPLPLAEYMHWCMADKTHGYYQTETVFGRTGDFVTAPEISQMFGELIGVWLISAWRELGSPGAFNLVEIGPGQGTLIADILRATKVDQAFRNAMSIHLIETSPQLIARQRETLSNTEVDVAWHPSINNIPKKPTLLVANELLDVLPVRQYVKSDEKWHERAVGLSDDDELSWVLATGTLEPTSLPEGHEDEPDGSVYEISAPRETFVENIAAKISDNTGAALFIDYGHGQSSFGDTFQAIAAHEFADPLKTPGSADLTSHVDFTPLETIVNATECTTYPLMTQGEFLLALGLLERAGALGQHADDATRKRLTEEAERLALPNQMGDLFKVFTFSTTSKLWPFTNET